MMRACIDCLQSGAAVARCVFGVTAVVRRCHLLACVYRSELPRVRPLRGSHMACARVGARAVCVVLGLFDLMSVCL